MKSTFTFLLLILAITWNTNAQGTLKIGHFDINYVLPQVPKAKAAQADIQAYSKKLQDDLALKDQELKVKYDKYLKEGAAMAEPTRNASEKELQTLQQQMQEFQSSAEQSIQKKQNDLMSPILADIEKNLKEVAKENGFTYIIRKEALIFETEDPTLDVSVLLLKKMGITPAPKGAATATKTTTGGK
jgi:outer membrane protein